MACLVHARLSPASPAHELGSYELGSHEPGSHELGHINSAHMSSAHINSAHINLAHVHELGSCMFILECLATVESRVEL